MTDKQTDRQTTHRVCCFRAVPRFGTGGEIPSAFGAVVGHTHDILLVANSSFSRGTSISLFSFVCSRKTSCGCGATQVLRVGPYLIREWCDQWQGSGWRHAVNLEQPQEIPLASSVPRNEALIDNVFDVSEPGMVEEEPRGLSLGRGRRQQLRDEVKARVVYEPNFLPQSPGRPLRVVIRPERQSGLSSSRHFTDVAHPRRYSSFWGVPRASKTKSSVCTSPRPANKGSGSIRWLEILILNLKSSAITQPRDQSSTNIP